MIRSVLVIASISLWALVQSAPTPYYTRSFVQTPTSTVEQYLIVPDKNNPYRVPATSVHHYSDFQFPRQQLVYYHPDGHNQYSLHEMKKDHPIMQQMMKDLNVNEDKMMDEMMKTSTDSNMMEKLKRDDGIITEMIDALKEAETTTSTEASKVFNEAIIVADDEEEIEKNEIPQNNVEMIKMMLQNVENSEDILKNSEIIGMMKKILENTENVEETSTAHPLMTQIVLSSSSPPVQSQSTEELMTMLKNNEISEEKMSRIVELMSNVDQLTVESTTARLAKTLNLEVVEESKSQPEIQLRLVEENQNVETSTVEANTIDLISTRELSLTEQVTSTTNEDIIPIKQSSAQIPPLNVMEMSRMDIIRSMLQSVEVLEQNLSLMQRINAEPEIGNEENLSDVTTESPRVESSTENERREITSTTTEFQESATQSAILIESSTLLENNEESTTENSLKVEDSTVLQILQRFESSDLEQSSTATTTESQAESSTTQSPFEQPSTSLDLSQSTESPIISEVRLSSEENLSDTTSEINERENSLEETTATPQTPQRENTRQGRVNNAPTIFLHNNRFYVVSGAPEFYANFDAYQNPRTPIFSLQELQPIRPIDKSTPVQRIEPFRVFAEERDDGKEQDNNNMSASTENDNERENEPLKMRSGSQDKRSDIENIRSMDETIVQNMEQRIMKKQEQQPAGEEIDRDLSEESSIAQANPSGIAIAGKGGVASARPSGTAVSGERGLSVASPQATAVAGLYDIDDEEDRKKIQQLRRLRRVRNY